jgi:predicted deacylase
MMKGMLEFLTGESPQALLLRQIFVIFIVPILNPDGVAYGNNRCSLSGVDLNRQWKNPLKSLHPTVYALKNFISLMSKKRDVNMYIDLHGHSRKYNVFMYGCDDKKKSKPLVRAFPKFFSEHSIGHS